MLDLTTIDQETLIARGQYSTLNKEQKQILKSVVELCSAMTSIGPQVVNYMQPRNGGTAETGGALGLLSYARDLIDKLEAAVMDADTVESAKASIKDTAWGKKP